MIVRRLSGILYTDDAIFLIPHRFMDHIINLQIDYTGNRQRDKSDETLKANQYFPQSHLAGPGKVSSYHIYGLVSRNDQGRNNSGTQRQKNKYG